MQVSFIGIIIDAAKKYHEYLVRQDKPISEAQKALLAKNNRVIQRRQRVQNNYVYIYQYIFMQVSINSCMKDG